MTSIFSRGSRGGIVSQTGSSEEKEAIMEHGVTENCADALRLDGDAAAGILSELFVPDITAALATCAGCGESR
jgi:hypothetical protein